MIMAEPAKKIDTLSSDEYRMAEVYVDNMMEYSRRRNEAEAWNRIKSDLEKSEKRMGLEGGIRSGQLRKNLGV